MNKDWLNLLLRQARVTPAELAKAAKLDPGLISRLRKGRQRPTYDTLMAIQKATKIPLINIYEEVGYLPKSSNDERTNRHIIYLLDQLPPEEREKELRRLELNVELSNGNENNAKPRTTHSGA